MNDLSRTFRTSVAKPDVVERMAHTMFVAEINYAHILEKGGQRFPQTEYFLVDVVTEEAVPKYLNMIDNELKAMMRFF